MTNLWKSPRNQLFTAAMLILLILAIVLVGMNYKTQSSFTIYASSNSAASSLDDIYTQMFPELEDFIIDLSLLQFPDDTATLYADDIDVAADMVGLSPVDITLERLKSYLELQTFSPELTKVLERLVEDLKQKGKNILIPDIVIEITVKREFVKHQIIEMAKVLDKIRERIKNENIHTRIDIEERMQQTIDKALKEIGFLFSENPTLMDLVEQVLKGEISIETFEELWEQNLPKLNWVWP